MAPGCYMLDFSVYKPPAEYKVNHTTGGENAKRWSVSSGLTTAGPAGAPGRPNKGSGSHESVY
jgi:hypothetical protein